MFNWRDIRILYARELRSALRERTIVVNSILLPILLYPLLLWLVYTGISFVAGQTEGYASRVMLRGLPARHESLRHQLEKKGERVEIKDVPDPSAKLRSGDLDVLIEFLPAAGAGSAIVDNFSVRMTLDESKDRSRIARDRMVERIRAYRRDFLEGQARALGIGPEKLQQFWVETRNVATSREMGQFLLGLMLPIFLIIMIAAGCMHPAIDSTAGEREKSTWETTMTTATSRANIVAAKYLYVSTLAATAGLLNVTAMVLSMKAVLAPIAGGSMEGFTFRLPLSSIPLIVLVTVLLSCFIAAGMMILASFARTFKEGQSMVSPFYIVTFMPVMFLQAPGIELTPTLALIPIVNVVMVFREAIGGVYRWPLIGVTVAVELACIFLALKLATMILRYEDFMLGTYGGNFVKFMKERVMRKRAGGGVR